MHRQTNGKLSLNNVWNVFYRDSVPLDARSKNTCKFLPSHTILCTSKWIKLRFSCTDSERNRPFRSDRLPANRSISKCKPVMELRFICSCSRSCNKLDRSCSKASIRLLTCCMNAAPTPSCESVCTRWLIASSHLWSFVSIQAGGSSRVCFWDVYKRQVVKCVKISLYRF